MTEEQIADKEIAKESVAKEQKPSGTISVPSLASIEDTLRASRIVMDKGSKVRFKEISTMFGKRKSEQNLLGYSLSAAAAFDILEPHKGRAPYVLSSFGSKLLTAPEEQQKKMLLPKFLAYSGYRDVLIGMRNSADQSMKKQTITDMWINVAPSAKVGTRKLYTRTFASVGTWCEALEDSGQTCVLKKDAESVLSQILKGEEIKAESQAQTSTQTSEASVKEAAQISVEMSKCPICNKSDLMVNEKYLDKVATKGGTILILERTFQCQGCSNKFSRVIREFVPSPD